MRVRQGKRTNARPLLLVEARKVRSSSGGDDDFLRRYLRQTDRSFARTNTSYALTPICLYVHWTRILRQPGRDLRTYFYGTTRPTSFFASLYFPHYEMNWETRARTSLPPLL